MIDESSGISEWSQWKNECFCEKSVAFQVFLIVSSTEFRYYSRLRRLIVINYAPGYVWTSSLVISSHQYFSHIHHQCNFKIFLELHWWWIWQHSHLPTHKFIDTLVSCNSFFVCTIWSCSRSRVLGILSSLFTLNETNILKIFTCCARCEII